MAQVMINVKAVSGRDRQESGKPPPRGYLFGRTCRLLMYRPAKSDKIPRRPEVEFSA